LFLGETMEVLFIFLLALFLDLLFGELPRPLHPVVWVGWLISIMVRRIPARGAGLQLVAGIAVSLSLILIFALSSYCFLSFLHGLVPLAYVIVAALLLKSTFALRELRRAVLKIEAYLFNHDLDKARSAMPSLVSRDPREMGEKEMVSAAIESGAENVCDSFIAPLFYFLLLGVPGAMAYRVVNTLDAMIGYHGKYEYLGKFAARLDDILNFFPARISALLLVAAAYLRREDGRNAWRIMLRDHGETESPNAGWTMGAMAGALRVKLEKTGYYIMGSGGGPATIQLIGSGVKLLDGAALLCILIYLILEVVIFAFFA
jgi:adenosylcobinamide-phosphate synthase